MDNTECSWKTAKKYADGEVNLQTKGKRKRKKTVMNGYGEWVEAWLVEDQRMPRKQRRTAKVIYELLLELGYQGSEMLKFIQNQFATLIPFGIFIVITISLSFMKAADLNMMIATGIIGLMII